MRKIVVGFLIMCLMTVSFGRISIYAQDLVGQGNGTVDQFDDKTTSVPINVKVLDQTSRYAVDVEFQQMNITFNGSLSWNVNTLEYEFPENVVIDNEFYIKIVNHSDKPIGFSAKATAIQGIPIDINCMAEQGVWRVSGLQSGDTEKAKRLNVKATPSGQSTWEDVAVKVASSNSSSVGSVEITIKPS